MEKNKSHLKLVKDDVPAHPSAETTREQAAELEDLHGTKETPSFETEQTEETLKHHKAGSGHA
jgi:hypothetical protein